MNANDKPNRRGFRKFLIPTLGALTLILALSWSWNTIAADMFGLPTMAFRHSLAFLTGIVILVTTISSSIRRSLSRRHAIEN